MAESPADKNAPAVAITPQQWVEYNSLRAAKSDTIVACTSFVVSVLLTALVFDSPAREFSRYAFPLSVLMFIYKFMMFVLCSMFGAAAIEYLRVRVRGAAKNE